MKLIDLLVKELPKRGGWVFGRNAVYQDWDGELRIDSQYNTTTKLLLPLSEFVRERGNPKSTLHNDAFVTREQYEAALAASQHPVWNGEGLPPVGCECQVYDCEAWHDVLVKFIGHKVVVVEDIANPSNGERVYHLAEKPDRFRPIRTEAERKRDEVIKQLAQSLSANYSVSPGQVAQLYEDIAAGKIPGVKLDI